MMAKPGLCRLMEGKRRPDVTEPRPSGEAGLTDLHRMEPAFDIAAPEFEKSTQFGEVRGNIELLPDEALQQVGMVRQVIDDLRGRQPIIAQRLHGVLTFSRFARCGQRACAVDRSATTENRIITAR